MHSGLRRARCTSPLGSVVARSRAWGGRVARVAVESWTEWQGPKCPTRDIPMATLVLDMAELLVSSFIFRGLVSEAVVV